MILMLTLVATTFTEDTAPMIRTLDRYFYHDLTFQAWCVLFSDLLGYAAVTCNVNLLQKLLKNAMLMLPKPQHPKYEFLRQRMFDKLDVSLFYVLRLHRYKASSSGLIQPCMLCESGYCTQHFVTMVSEDIMLTIINIILKDPRYAPLNLNQYFNQAIWNNFSSAAKLLLDTGFVDVSRNNNYALKQAIAAEKKPEVYTKMILAHPTFKFNDGNYIENVFDMCKIKVLPFWNEDDFIEDRRNDGMVESFMLMCEHPKFASVHAAEIGKKPLQWAVEDKKVDVVGRLLKIDAVRAGASPELLAEADSLLEQ